MTKIFAALFGLALLLVPVCASAQDDGFYVAGDFGYHAPQLDDTKINAFIFNTNFSAGNDWDTFARLGYGFADDWRVELELGYRPSDIREHRLTGVIPYDFVVLPHFGEGNNDTTTLMANVLYDIPLGLDIQPFVGAGVGVVHADLKHGAAIACPLCLHPDICTIYGCAGAGVSVDDSVDKFGWQVMGGASWAFAPQFNLDLTYRYIRAENLTWTAQNVFFAGHPTIRAGYSDNSVTLGVRYSFGE